MNDTTGTKKKRVSGWLSIKEPSDLERALQRMMNRILSSEDPLAHCGRFASLANSWINARRLKIESEELKQLQQEVEELKASMDRQEHRR